MHPSTSCVRVGKVEEGNNMGIVASRQFKGEATRVAGYPIDSIMPQLPLRRPMAFKLNVEGAELQALEGAVKLLTSDVVNVVWAYMELRSIPLQRHGQEPKISAIFAALNKQGLQPYRQDRAGVETLLDINEPEKWVHARHPHINYFDVIWHS